MAYRILSRANFNRTLLGLLLLLVVGSVISYVIYGPYYSPDTVNYFNYSLHLFNSSKWQGIYSPAYPFLLHALRLTGLSTFSAANVLIIIQYGISIYFLYCWTKITAEHYWLSRRKQMSLLLLLLIVFHSWWSYRMITWAHADSIFYCLLIIWAYCLCRCYLSTHWMQLLILSLFSAALISVKLNTLAIVPFFLSLLVWDKDRIRWLAPLVATLTSYIAYKAISGYEFWGAANAADEATDPLPKDSILLLFNNLSLFFKSTLGFFLSDYLTAHIPFLLAVIGGIILLALCFYLAFFEIRKSLTLTSVYLLFGLVYLLCQLAFLQMIGSEEINYRTLFPFFLVGSWYGLVKFFYVRRVAAKTMLCIALLIAGHSMVGYVWTWNRHDVNSLFDVNRLQKSSFTEKLRQHDQSTQIITFASNRPEMLGLLLDNPSVVAYNPEFLFIQGKRREVSESRRKELLRQLMKRLQYGELVLVLFGQDPSLYEFMNIHNLQITKFEEGLILSVKKRPDNNCST